jgi:hypothetical protein
MRNSVAGAVAAAVLIASCGPSGASPSAESSPSATVSAPGATSTVIPTEALGPTPSPTLAIRWEAAGAMAMGRLAPRAVVLGDGSVLVVGNDDPRCVRDDSVATEIWSPERAAWTSGPSLSKPRADFVALRAGRGSVLITGGVNPGLVGASGLQDNHQAYSSTFLLDPLAAAAGWRRTGLLRTARVAPAAATLSDGRVLVAGGYYLSGDEQFQGSVGGAALAAYRAPSPWAAGGPAPIADSGPPPQLVPALATVEVFDPATDAWTGAGSLRYARVGAQAVTLADGRVLVAGSWTDFMSWNSAAEVRVDPRAVETAEIYDPHTGRSTLTGAFPRMAGPDSQGPSPTPAPSTDYAAPSPWSPFPAPDENVGITAPGTLVATDDGGALVVGQVSSWSKDGAGMTGIRVLRLNPATNAWTTLDQRVLMVEQFEENVPISSPYPSFKTVTRYRVTESVQGHAREAAMVTRLADGRVLVAGGLDYDNAASMPEANPIGATSKADLYDPATDTWTALPSLPSPWVNGTAVALPDGSALIMGGTQSVTGSLEDGCGLTPTGLTSVARLILR